MKKILLIFNFTFLIFNSVFPQAGEWVWIKGDNITSQPGNFGVQGVPAPTNNPPSLYESCEWTDLNGNFWLFGGSNSNSSVNVYNDLWKYDPVTNEWTWLKGPGIPNDPGNYGIQGVPSPGNIPPSRSWGTPTWVDNQNNLWLFGGDNFSAGNLNDLWKYDISANEWVWMKGANISNQPGIYGIQGIPDPTNTPGSRNETSAAWTDNAGDLWLFGGTGFNDLWRYNIASDQWTWMKGDSTVFATGVYGSIGIENAANTPGARMAYSHWKDNSGNLWLFGGNGTGYFNDLWRYNLITNNWTWMSGSNTAGAMGVYGTKCNAALSNVPGARYENRAVWSDQYGNFWFFGGAQGSGFASVWNDLWMYCISTHQWIWISGDNLVDPPGNWGTLGISSPLNKPDGRGGTTGWTDHNGHLYFFGGYGSFSLSYYNDLWKYTIDTACGVCPNTTSIAENNPPKADDLLVFPNPTNSSLTISFSLSEKQNIELRIYNTLGKQIYFSKEEITKGKFEKEINVEKLSDGIYFLQLKNKERNINRKVVINH